MSDHRDQRVSTWTAEYLGQAVAQFRDQGRQVDDALLTHISPAQIESIRLFGTITVDIDAETRPTRTHRPPATDPYADRSRPSASPDQPVL